MNSLPFSNNFALNQQLMWVAQNYFIPYYRSQTGFNNSLEAPYLNANFYHQAQLMALYQSQQPNTQSMPIENRTPEFNGEAPEKSSANPKKISKTQKKRPSNAKPVNKMFKSFVDLVDRAAGLWLNRLNENGSEDILDPITEQFLKCEQITDFKISDPQEMPMSQEEDTDKDIRIFLAKETDQIDDNNFNRISNRKIKKAPKTGKDNWTRKHDSRLLSLVEELGQDWIQISGAFEESFVTPKYLQERYQALCNKKLGFKQQESSDHDNFDLTSSHGLHRDNWDTISNFFVSTQADDTVKDFCMMIRDDMPEMALEPESLKSSFPIRKMSKELWQEGKEDGFEAFEEMMNSMHLQVTREGSSSSPSCFEAKHEKLQEDTIDLYFNTNNEEIEQTLLKNKDFLEKVDFFEDSEKTKERVQPEEDVIVIGEKLRDEKPQEEVIDILHGRVSLIQSLIQQTRIELMKLQSEAKNKNIV